MFLISLKECIDLFLSHMFTSSIFLLSIQYLHHIIHISRWIVWNHLLQLIKEHVDLFSISSLNYILELFPIFSMLTHSLSKFVLFIFSQLSMNIVLFKAIDNLLLIFVVSISIYFGLKSSPKILKFMCDLLNGQLRKYLLDLLDVFPVFSDTFDYSGILLFCPHYRIGFTFYENTLLLLDNFFYFFFFD